MTKKFVREQKEQPVPLHEAISNFLHSPEVTRLEQGTREEYTQELTRFANWAQGITLDQVNARTVDSFLGYLKKTGKPHKAGQKELSTYTLHSYVRVILTFLNWCFDSGEYDTQISLEAIRRIKKPKVIKTLVETFSSEQIIALRKACAKEFLPHLALRDETILLLLLDTGIRAKELCTLKIAHVDYSTAHPFVKILGKGSKWGEVGFGAETRKYLGQYARKFRLPVLASQLKEQSRGKSDRELARLEVQLKETTPFFMNRYGEQLTPRGLDRIFSRLGQWANISGVRCSPHTFRHTFASMFMRNGGDIYTLSKLLRHSSVKVTEEYLKSIRQWELRYHAQSVVDHLGEK